MYKGCWAHFPPILKLLILFLTVLCCGSLTGIVMGAIAEPLYGVDIASSESMSSNVCFMQTFQIFQSISFFIIPSLLGFYFFFDSFRLAFNQSGKTSILIVALSIVVIIFGQGFISYSAWLNHQITLPESMDSLYNWMIEKESEVGKLTMLMIRTDNVWQVGLTIFMMSILPAIGEEWLFRGLLQRGLADFFRNHHMAIIITALLFSAIHMQFLTFLPRFFLGIILGYLFYLSKNLWMPVIAHFTNNFMAIVSYMILSDESGASPLEVPKDNPFGFIVVLSALTIIVCLYLVHTKQRFNEEEA